MGFRFLYPLMDRASGITWLLRDEFTTADAAPVTSPRTCEPGPGTLTFDQTDGTFAIAGANLDFTAQSTPTWGDQGFWTPAQTRAAGLAMFNVLNLSTWEECGIGWHTAAADVDPDTMEHAIQANTTDGRFDNHNATSIITGLSTSTDYKLAQVLRGTGAFQFLKAGSDWTLLWVDNAGATATLYPAFANLDGAGYVDSFRVAQLPAPFDTDNGYATDSIASPVATNTITHEADCLIEFEATTLPSSDRIKFWFRYQDDNNRWTLIINSSGDINLYETVGGSGTLRGSSDGALSGGERIMIIADDEDITVYYDNTAAFTYGSAANFKTQTSGVVNDTGIGGVISNLITWARTPSGTALSILDQYTA